MANFGYFCLWCEHTLELRGSLSSCRGREGWERGRKWSKGENTKLLTLNSTVKLSVTWNYSSWNILSNQAYISTWPFIQMYPKIYFWKPTLPSSENRRQLINVSEPQESSNSYNGDNLMIWSVLPSLLTCKRQNLWN